MGWSSPPATGRSPRRAAGRRPRYATACPRSAPAAGTPWAWSFTTPPERHDGARGGTAGIARVVGGGWQTASMTEPDPKADLHRYLQAAREALLWKLEGLSEYDIRRPLTPTGTNLLGLVKHVAGVELWYFGDAFGR